MALTFSNEEMHVLGDMRVWLVSINFDNSYPTGGEAIATSDLSGCSSIAFAQVGSVDDATYRCTWDRTNSKLKLYVEDGTSGIEAEAANTSDQSAVNIELLVFGK